MNVSMVSFLPRNDFNLFDCRNSSYLDVISSSSGSFTSNSLLALIPSSFRKRGPEELLSPLSNGATMSPQPTAVSVENDAKKAKLDSPNSRSRVVHLRNVPPDITELDLIHICIPFGKVVNLLLLKGKSQAFVEYADEVSAAQLVSVSSTCPINVRGRTIFCQYSNHQELRTDKQASLAASSGAVSLASPQSNGADLSVIALTTASATQQQPSSVLRVIVENMLYPVSLDVLHQIFSRFGKVLRIITFTKNGTFQALLQFSESNAAQLAKSALDGQNIYSGCCTLRIDYSKLSTLNVKYNNDKSRDYTNPHLPSGDLALDHTLGLANLGLFSGAAGVLNHAAGPSLAAASALHNPLANASLQFGNATFSAPALQQAAALQAASAGTALNLPALALSGGTTNALAGVAGLRLPAQLTLNLSPVVLVSNLNEEKVTCDALFTLFGVYGDVQRVKILFNKKDNALVQFAEPGQAHQAIQNLDKVKLWGKQIRVAASKHMNVQMPKEGQPDAGLTKDFSQSPLHRFKKPGSKNYMNIYPPSATLHLSNIPPNVTEEFLMDAFRTSGFQVLGFKFFPKDHKMALIQLGSVDEALGAVVQMHNFKLAENAHLRVSFSKSGI